MEQQSEDEILRNMLQIANEKGLISTDENIFELFQQGQLSENQYILFLSIYAHVMSQMNDEMITLQENQDVNTATGAQLDNMGNIVNVRRITSQPAIMYITARPEIGTSTEILIPEGTPIAFQSLAAVSTEFVTSEQVIIPEDTESAITIKCESNDRHRITPLPENLAIGIVGFSNVIVESSTASTSGRDYEEDDVYRQRLKTWAAIHTIGTKQCIATYLDGMDVVNDYRIVPRPAPEHAPGTLLLICDTLPGELERIRDEVYDNCMIITDELPTVVLPSYHTLDELRVCVTVYSDSSVSQEELGKLIVSQLRVYLSGGVTRLNQRLPGLRVGADFVPSDCIRFLLEHFPEVENVYFEVENDGVVSAVNTPILVDDDKKFRVTTIPVVYPV